MFPSSNRTNNHLFLDTRSTDWRFFNDDELLNHIFWQEQLISTSDEVSKANNAMADDVREEKMEEKQYQKKKEREGSKDWRVSPPPRRRTGKKDRHSKIRTANGLRDRRIRLSVQVSKKFFELHDILGFDKASKTLDWLFLKSKEAIKDLTKSSRRSSLSERIVNQVNNNGGGGADGGSRGGKGLSSVSESDVISNDAEDDGSENMVSIGEGASSNVPKTRKRGKLCTQQVDLAKKRDSRRMKARARARERTREKMMGKGLGTSPKQACELKDTAPDVGEPNINQETRFLGHTTQEMSQIYDDCPMDSPRLFERFLGITSTDIFGPYSNTLCEMIRGTEFVAGAMHDLLGYDYDSTTQHHNLNANFIPMSTSEPNPNLMILPSRSIKEQKPTLPMIVDDSQAAGN